MKALKLTIGALGVVAMLAIPAAASADNSPVVDGWQMKEGSNYSSLPQQTTGRDNSQITHNGWSVGGNKHQLAVGSVYGGADQTTGPGTRADLVGANGH